MRVFGEDVLAFPCGGVVIADLTQLGPMKAIQPPWPAVHRPPIAPARFNGGLAEMTCKTTCPRCSENPDDGGHCANGTHQDTPA